MSQYTYSIEITRPPQQVFAYLDSADHVKNWIGGLVEMIPLTEGGNRVGAKTKQVYEENGRRIEMLEETLIYEPNRRVKIRGESNGFWLTAEYTLNPTNTGTRIDYVAEVHGTSLFMKIAIPFIAWTSKKRVAEDLGRLKSLVEK